MMSSVVVIANTLWPSQPPTWEAPGGVLKTYFQNIIGRCDGNKVLVAINKATGIKECANANSLISVANFGVCPATNSYPKLYFTFGSSSVSSKIRLIWSSENTTQCSISGISTTATGWSLDVSANASSYTLSCSGVDGSTVSQTLNTTSIWSVGDSITWPTVNPSGESTWGIFGNYLSNLGWEIGKCSSNEVIVGFEANGKPKCVVASSLMSASSCPGSSDPYINFTATPSNIAPWDPVTLAWQAGNLTSCTTSDAFVINGSSSWTALIHPTATSTYRITCSDDAGRQMQKSVSVTVTPPPIPGGWSSFGACQTSCTKTRTCTNPTPQNGWLTCQNDTQGGATVSCYGGSCAPICGNGFQESGETCDSGSNNGQPGHCNGTCSAVVPLPYCWDGLVNQPSEFCDNGTDNWKPWFCSTRCNEYSPAMWFLFNAISVPVLPSSWTQIDFGWRQLPYEWWKLVRARSWNACFGNKSGNPNSCNDSSNIILVDAIKENIDSSATPGSTGWRYVYLGESRDENIEGWNYTFDNDEIKIPFWTTIDFRWIVPKNYAPNWSCDITFEFWWNENTYQSSNKEVFNVFPHSNDYSPTYYLKFDSSRNLSANYYHRRSLFETNGARYVSWSRQITFNAWVCWSYTPNVGRREECYVTMACGSLDVDLRRIGAFGSKKLKIIVSQQ